MPKLKAIYRCQECGYSAAKPMGQCPDCSNWNSMVEEVIESRSLALAGASSGSSRSLTDFSSKPVLLNAVSSTEEKRWATQLPELDRLLGGGLVAGQVVLLAGPPGIGKSTLMLQAACRLSAEGKVLYASGEESLKQVASRAKRLGVSSESLFLVSETSLSKILGAIEQVKPKAVILDSVQTCYHPELSSSPGSVAQVRECAAALLRLAKEGELVVFLLGHVTKDGTVAGPKVLEHIVDTVLYFDSERHDVLRVLRAQKNRFGPTDETGLFEMRETGLCGVVDAARFFIEARDGGSAPGRSVGVGLEGSRPILVEAQSLVVSTRYPLPRRMSTGLELNRVLVLLAAMEKHLRLRIEDSDVFVSLAGGLRLKDPALDLAACLSVVSSARDAKLCEDWVFVGEVGLLGEIGRVPQLEARLRAAAKAGFKKALVPARSVKDLSAVGLEVVGADDIADAVRIALGKEK